MGLPYQHLFALFFLLSLSYSASTQDFSDQEQMLQEEFLKAADGDTIYVPEGIISLRRTLWLDDVSNVTLLGKGMDETILDFSGQIDGAEGIKITNSRNILVANLTVREAKGDGIKIQDTDGITLDAVRAEWTGKPDKNNGAYGLYPVLSKRVRIINCEAIGASDAGIYVGQSEDIIVKNNSVYFNVAGIEIENSDRADVFNNNAYGNTGGILIFDLPDLQKKRGSGIRVFNNIVTENNLKNFAPKGNIVGKVPQGTGVLVLATSGVEITGNEIKNNRTVGLGIMSYYITELPITDKEYNPVANRIRIENNTFDRLRTRATLRGRMGKMFRFKLKFGKDVPHIIWDGIVDSSNPFKMCITGNRNESYVNIDAEHDFNTLSFTNDHKECQIPRIEPVKFN